MGRPANSTVRHGMASCARYGCKRPECMEAQRRAQRAGEADLKQGMRAVVPADEAMAHGKALVEAGMPPVDIARWTGLGDATVRDILNGRVRQIYRTTAEAILFLPLPDGQYQPGGQAFVDATASRRRLCALGALGWPPRTLAHEIEVSEMTIADIRHGQCRKVRLATHLSIKEMYDKWWKVDPLDYGVNRTSVTMTKARAAREGWPPPAAWDDDEIGDPAAQPGGFLRVEARSA